MTVPNINPGRHDSLFREIITAGWAVKSDGNVEAPTGAFSLVEIPDTTGELTEMRDAITCDENRPPDEYQFLTAWPSAGWYFVTENSLGQVSRWMLDKARAEKMYALYEEMFSEWMEDENDEPDLPSLFINGQDLKKGNKLLLPFGKEATVLDEPKVGRIYVSFRTEHGPTRVKLFDILNIERPK